MSVTRPTLIFLPCGALDAELLLELLPPPPLSLLLLPHAATPKAPTAMVRAIAIARKVLRCTAPPLRFLLEGPDSLRSRRAVYVGRPSPSSSRASRAARSGGSAKQASIAGRGAPLSSASAIPKRPRGAGDSPPAEAPKEG